MNNLGLSKDTLSSIVAVIAQNPNVTEAIVFGSRAKEQSKPFSDIDIALRGNCTALDIEEIKCNLDDLPLAYSFDVIAYDSIKNTSLQQHIDRVGVVVYTTNVFMKPESHYGE